MESKTFARTSAHRYRIVDAEERLYSILFNTISSFCGLKRIEINKTKKSKNIRHNYELTFSPQKKNFQKENMFEPCDVICHVTVAFYIYHFINALTLYVIHIIRCALTSATTFICSTIHKNIKKVEKISK
jgi:hypothetical protein